MLPPKSTIPLSFSLLHEYLRLVFRRESQSFSLSPPPPSAKAGLRPGPLNCPVLPLPSVPLTQTLTRDPFLFPAFIPSLWIESQQLSRLYNPDRRTGHSFLPTLLLNHSQVSSELGWWLDHCCLRDLLVLGAVRAPPPVITLTPLKKGKRKLLKRLQRITLQENNFLSFVLTRHPLCKLGDYLFSLPCS